MACQLGTSFSTQAVLALRRHRTGIPSFDLLEVLACKLEIYICGACGEVAAVESLVVCGLCVGVVPGPVVAASSCAVHVSAEVYLDSQLTDRFGDIFAYWIVADHYRDSLSELSLSCNSFGHVEVLVHLGI